MIYAAYKKHPLGDELYTPRYAVIPILKYLPKDKIIWCPFDTEHSEFVIALKEAGYNVVYSHIYTGQDFFKYEPERWDIIVSNPPFSNKQKIVERCIVLRKPFALLLSNLWLNSSAPCRFFKDGEMQILLFDRRVNYSKKNAVFFGSSYFCHSILPKQIIFENLIVEKEMSRMREDIHIPQTEINP